MRFKPSYLILLASLAFTGCGPSLGSITGTIKVNGEPKKDLVVSFTPMGGGTSAAATTDENGAYTVTSTLGNGLPPGNYKVSITTRKSTINDSSMYQEESYDPDSYGKKAQESMESKDQYGGKLKADAGAKEPIPEKYNKKTELKAEVVSGPQVCDYQIDM